ncbi:MAG TPA: hypothetical protein VKD70_03790 [Candidatus Acidoferrum sp.]|nr:hypothetical protein [Candidatus Acidoferrum sp.]
MHFLRRRSLLFLIVWVVLFSTSGLARTPDLVSRVQVSIFDDAHLDPGTLAQAQARASQVFAQSGIELDWLVCPPRDPQDFSPSTSPCSALSWPDHLSVRIIPRGRTIAAEIFGQAFVDDSGHGVYSNVYYQNLLLSRDHPGVSDADMLGYVIAHELGHLLLGSNSHSASGLMQATWTPHTLSAPRASLFFTSAQTSLLRSRLAPPPQTIASWSALAPHLPSFARRPESL